MIVSRTVIAWSIVALLVAACATSPTGRRQLKLVSDEQMNEMGVASFTQLKKEVPESKDAKASGYVTCVAKAITGVMAPNQAWEVRVFDDKQVNAFALPGGKIGVYTGLLKVATNQDQLAAVVGHETAHVIAGHSSERVSESMAAQLGLSVVEASTGVSSEMLGVATSVFFLLPHSRTHESEADILGQDYMAKAGFDPRQSIALWENMAKAGGQKPPEMLSTHPSDTTRIRQLTERLPVSMPLYEAAKAQGRTPRCG
jgi:predicted Zn-dependent protease